MNITLDSFNLVDAERRLIVAALERAGSIVGAAALLGTTRHGLKRRVIKHRIMWPREMSPVGPAQASSVTETCAWDPTSAGPEPFALRMQLKHLAFGLSADDPIRQAFVTLDCRLARCTE